MYIQCERKAFLYQAVTTYCPLCCV